MFDFFLLVKLIPSITKNLNDFKNQAIVGITGWMEALADKSTQIIKESTIHNIVTFHTTIPT